MASSFSPSAPPMPESSASNPTHEPINNPYNNNPTYNYNYNPNPNQNNQNQNYNHPPPAQSYHVAHQPYSSSSSSSSSSHPPPASSASPYGGYGYNNYNPFPPGTDPEVIRSFQMVDRDASGFIDDSELQQALSSGYQRFSLRTIRLLMFLFKNPNESSLRIGPNEFAALWSCLGQWRAIFERFDRDRSGKIDAVELRDALYSLGYAVPPPVLHLLISHYTDGSGRKAELNFDSFVECGVVIRGLTDKFKEKDPRYTGSATLTYDSFMSMVLPFLVTYN